MGRFPLGYVAKTALQKGYWRLATDMGGPARAVNLRVGQCETFADLRITNFSGIGQKRDEILSGHFVYANQELDVGAQGDPWTIPAPSERFAYWLHSFDWLPHLSVGQHKMAAVRARFLVDRWIEVYGEWNPYAWDNDIIANRLFAWLTLWSPLLSMDRLSNLAQNRRNSTVRQLTRLKNTYNRTPHGLPKFKAAAVIALGGLIIPSKPDKFLNRGLDWLDEEIDKQILPDGGHVSRSPQQSLQALHILTVLNQALQKRGVEATRAHHRALDRLRHIVPFFQHPDKGLGSFHGSGESDAKYAQALLKSSDLEVKPFTYAPHTGFQRVEQGETVILVDCGETPDHPYDETAHLGPLAFEMSTQSGRLIVNCGWGREQPSNWRQAIRETSAHSTLVLDNRSAGNRLSSGLAARVFQNSFENGVDETQVSRMEQANGVWLEMSHHGYLKQSGLSHRRRIYINDLGTDIRGEDSLAVPIGMTPMSRDEIPFDIRFHMHPSVRATLAQDLHSALLIQPGKVGWRFRTDGGPMRIEESVYLGAGSKPVKTEQIVISGHAFADSDGQTKSNRVRWSIKRLEAR